MAKHPQNTAQEKEIETLIQEQATDQSHETANSVVVSDAGQDGEVVEDETPKGTRVRRSFAMKNLLPDQDWINKNIVSKGKGHQETIGRFYGVAHSADDKSAKLPDGTESVVIAMNGFFNAESYITGEISECSTAYLARAYAEKVKFIFKTDPSIKLVEIDCDVALEATGKPIAYEWVIKAYIEGQEMAVMKRLRKSRGRPENAAKLLPSKNLQLTDGTKSV